MHKERPRLLHIKRYNFETFFARILLLCYEPNFILNLSVLPYHQITQASVHQCVSFADTIRLVLLLKLWDRGHKEVDN